LQHRQESIILHCNHLCYVTTPDGDLDSLRLSGLRVTGMKWPENLSAVREGETSVSDAVPWPWDSGSEDDTFGEQVAAEYPGATTWVMDLPRCTWIPMDLLEEWEATRSDSGWLGTPSDAAGLEALFALVCGPLEGEVLGWQKVQALHAAQLFSFPSSWIKDHPEVRILSTSALWALYWHARFKTLPEKVRGLGMVVGKRDFGLWMFEGGQWMQQGRFLWQSARDFLYHTLARKNQNGDTFLHVWSLEALPPDFREAMDSEWPQWELVKAPENPEYAPALPTALMEGLYLWETPFA